MDFPKRNSNRLKGWDYSNNGAYFITICSKNKENIFWTVGATCGRQKENIPLSDIGKLIDKEINKIPTIYENILIDKYTIMPNHIHLIIIIANDFGRPKVAPTISRIIQQYKGSVSKQIGYPVWQKLFHDHIIRDENDYLRIWKYIDENPIKWNLDCYYS